MTPRNYTQTEQALRALMACASEEITSGRCIDALATLKSMVLLLEQEADVEMEERWMPGTVSFGCF